MFSCLLFECLKNCWFWSVMNGDAQSMNAGRHIWYHCWKTLSCVHTDLGLKTSLYNIRSAASIYCVLAGPAALPSGGQEWSPAVDKVRSIFPFYMTWPTPSGMVLVLVKSGVCQATPGFGWLEGTLRGTGTCRSTRFIWPTRGNINARCSRGTPPSPFGQKLLGWKFDPLALFRSLPDQLPLN